VLHGKRHGFEMEYYPSGGVKTKAFFQEDLPEGVARSWFEDGQLASDRFYKEGKCVGEQMEYFPSKNLQQLDQERVFRVSNYNENSEMDGEQKTFYQNGKLQLIMNYHCGFLNGDKFLWDEQGELLEEAHYVQGKLHGPWFQKDASGRKIFCTYQHNKKEGIFECFYPESSGKDKVKAIEAVYKRGKLDGLVTEYNENGKKVVQFFCYNGKKNGEAMKFDDKERVMRKMYFSDDKKEGNVTHFYASGSIYKVTPFSNDVIDGVEKIFHENGQLLYRAAYQQGLLQGMMEAWNEQGNKIFEGTYSSGKKDGNFNKFYENGKPKIFQVYKDDILLSKQEFLEEAG